MRTLLHRTLAAALLTGALTACADAPSAPAPASAVRATWSRPGHLEEVEYELRDYGLQLGCEDGTLSEVVNVNGTVVERDRHVQLPNGTVISRTEVRDRDLRGVGTGSGHPYDVERRVVDFGMYADAGILGSRLEHWSLRDEVTGRLYSLTYRLKYAMDEDRDIIYSREREKVRCR